MWFVRSVSGGSAVERTRMGGPELTAEEDLSHPGTRLDDRRQPSRETRGRKKVQVCVYLPIYRHDGTEHLFFDIYVAYIMIDSFCAFALLDFLPNYRPTIIWKSHKCY